MSWLFSESGFLNISSGLTNFVLVLLSPLMLRLLPTSFVGRWVRSDCSGCLRLRQCAESGQRYYIVLRGCLFLFRDLPSSSVKDGLIPSPIGQNRWAHPQFATVNHAITALRTPRESYSQRLGISSHAQAASLGGSTRHPMWDSAARRGGRHSPAVAAWEALVGQLLFDA